MNSELATSPRHTRTAIIAEMATVLADAGTTNIESAIARTNVSPQEISATFGGKRELLLAMVSQLSDSMSAPPLRAKVVQENLIKASGVPYTILRSTQFFEFGGRIADEGTRGIMVRVPAEALIQPILSNDVVSVLAEIAVGPPLNGTVEVGGPDRIRFDEFIVRALRVQHDKRKVVADPDARFFGTELDEDALIPGSKARIGRTRFDAWLSAQARP
jgi:uncharacterized protein YbjT (DUF2867 family)